MIHIGLCADERFALPLGVCVSSIFMSNTKNDVFIHVLTQGLSDDTISKLENTASEFDQKIQLYKVDESLFDNYPLSDFFPHSIYFRYLLPDILPEEIDKIIYLDSDTVVIDDLSDLWNTNIENNPIAAVQDSNGDDIYNRNRIEIFDGKYLNSGVLLMNLTLWRKENSFSQLAKFIQDFPERCVFPDQDALNVIFHNRIKWLSFRYNFQTILCEDFCKYRLHKSNYPDICESFANIVVVHYSSMMIKPWISDVEHPLTFIWRFIFHNSNWRNTKLKPRYNFAMRYIKTKLHMPPYYPKAALNREFTDIISRYIKSYQ